jgi:hypothetical protein
MSSFGVGGHAHVEAGFLAILATLLTYGIKWLFGLTFPDHILVVPTFMAVFIAFYTILYVVFLMLWSNN